MNKKVNITKLAEYCGVSPSTISRVFNGTTYVAPEKREKILRAASKFNYIPSAKAQRDTVALIVSFQHWIYSAAQFTSMLTCHLLKELSAQGYKTIICRADEFPGLNPRIVAAGILMDWSLDLESVKKLARAKIPVVGINIFSANLNSICFDHAGQTLAAVKYLVREGHRKIAFLEPPPINWGSSERRRGYRLGLEEADIPYDDRFLDVHDDCSSLVPEKLKNMLFECAPTALICLHEDWLLQLHDLLISFGYRIGDEISLITGELPGVMDVLSPGITSVGQDADQLVRAAVEMIENLKDKPILMGGVMHYMFPCRIIKRNSVKKLNR